MTAQAISTLRTCLSAIAALRHTACAGTRPTLRALFPAALRHALYPATLALTLAAQAQQTLPAVPPAPRADVTPRYVVLLDAAHGGPETGARLSTQLLEKDLTLALSIRLRSTLTAHGITVITTREDDTNPAPDTRAAAANRSHASACLILHATTSGTGVHLYTSSLPPAQPAPGPKPWATAQAPYITQSLKLSSDLSEALGHSGVPVTLGSVSLQPSDSMACPAVLVEAAPLLARRNQTPAALADPAYQSRLVDALAGALEQWRSDWKAQP